MTQTMHDFDDRLRRIARDRGGHGRVMRFEVDDYGKIRRRKPRRFRVLRLLRAFCFLILALYLFKVAAFATLGDSAIALRSRDLADGSGWEQLIGKLMQPDPLTGVLAGHLRPLLKDL